MTLIYAFMCKTFKDFNLDADVRNKRRREKVSMDIVSPVQGGQGCECSFKIFAFYMDENWDDHV